MINDDRSVHQRINKSKETHDPPPPPSSSWHVSLVNLSHSHFLLLSHSLSLFLSLFKINWTVLYRRKHRKGMVEEAAKKRTRRTQKFMRAVTGATLADIMAKRNQKPEVRKAQRYNWHLSSKLTILNKYCNWCFMRGWYLKPGYALHHAFPLLQGASRARG